MDIIWDVDGTLLDIQHRVPCIRPPEGTRKDWKKFRSLAQFDTPIAPNIAVCRALFDYGHRIIITTGRMEEEREITVLTLNRYGVNWYDMFMRAQDDHRIDCVVKRELLYFMREKGINPILAFDDRQQVVDMWRGEGLICMQVAKGDF
jgi:FMN phosphatase YigB (HAD superfamily)